MPRYLVLKELPQGQQPGETIDVDEAVGDVLLLVGAASKVEAVADEPPPADEPAPSPARRRYQRRDLEAEP